MQSSAEKDVDLLLNVAIEHRLMHVETLAYMLHQLPHDRKLRPPHRLVLITDPIAPAMTEIPSGLATLGMARNAMQFGWDNEYEIHRVEVPAFAIDRYMVTNRQYLDFVASGGYQNEAL